MAIGPLPPVISEIQANSGQPGKTLAQQTAASALLDLQATVAEPAAAIVPETTLIDKAVAEALGRQGGLASLYATLVELADAPELPDAVKAAVDTVLAFRLGDGEVTPERVAQAIRASGLFHEAVAAGKMAAALPPVLRQALGSAQEQKPQAIAQPAASAPLPASAARPASAVPASPPPVAGRPSLATPANVSQSGSPASVPTNLTTSDAARVAAQPVVLGSLTPPVVTAPAANPAAPSPNGIAFTSSAAVDPALSTAPGESPSGTSQGTAAAAPLPATSGIAPDSSIPSPTQAHMTGDAGVASVPQTVSPTAPPPPSPTSSLPPTTPIAGQPVSSPTPPPGGADQSPAPSLASTSSSPEPSTPAPSSPAATSTPSANVAASSRAFAPWTPGRPLAPPAPAAASALQQVGTTSGAEPALPLTATPIPPGSEAAVHRLPGDRAPFVPSTVDSLPTASPEPGVTSRTPASPTAPPPVADAQTRSAVAYPSASSPQSGSVIAAGPGGGQSQEAPPQIRPAPAPSVDALAPTVRQSASPMAAAPTVATPLAVGVDLKGALDGLRRELVAWLGRNADVMASLDGASDDAAITRIDRPPPPRKGGPVRGQPAMPLLDGDEAEAASTETLAGRALGETERSLSRVFLHQAATAESRDMKAAQPMPALMLEIPIAGPNGTSIAQLRIERDDHAPTEPGASPRRVFQVDIAFDIAPLGPVAVRVGLMDGRRVAVGVWCESDDGLVRMEAERENIVLGLEQEGMVVAGVDLHRGHPPEGRDEMAAAPSHRLDLQL